LAYVLFGNCDWVRLGRGHLTLGAGKAVAAAAWGLAVGAALAGCMTTGSEPAPAPAPSAALVSPQMLVGKWGLASYRKEADRARTETQAHDQCNKPYVIGKGPSGGVMMYQPDQSKAQELVVKTAGGKTYIGPAEEPAGGPLDRQVVTFESNEFITVWMDPDVVSRYGTMVFVRCK
jgi:hypothetical protein